MRLQWLMFLLGLAAALAIARPGAAWQADAFLPDYGIPIVPADSTLTIGDQTLRPVGYGGGAPHTFEAAGGFLTINGPLVTYRGSDGKEWSRKDGPPDPHVLDVRNGIAYVVDLTGLAWYSGSHASAQVLRLDVGAGRWLSSIPMTGSDKVVGVAASDNEVAVLTSVYGPKSEFDTPTAYVLTLYRLPDLQLVRSVHIEAQIQYEASGINSWPRNADTETIGTRTVQWSNGAVVICPDDQGPLCSFDSEGVERWQLDRPWEFVRSFNGPSVFSFTLHRSSQPAYSAQDPHAKIPPDKSMSGEITAGPIWVPAPKAGGTEGRIVLAVARSADARGSTESLIYEISAGGQPMTVTALPQQALTLPEGLVSGGVVWAGEQGSMFRIHPGLTTRDMGMGPFPKPNLTSWIDWFVQKPPRQADELLDDYPASGQPDTDAIAFSQKYAFRTDEGWHASEPKSRRITFPIQVVDLATGAQSLANLQVHLAEDLRAPATNLEGSGDHFAAFVPYPFEICDMQVYGANLRITFNIYRVTGPWAYLDFPLPKDFR